MNLPHSLSRGIYLMDAAGTFALGLLLIVFTAPLAMAGGTVLTEPVLFWIGVLLVPWAGFNLLLGRKASPVRTAVWVNIAGDALWVVASFGLLLAAAPGFTTPGALVVGVLAVAVGFIGLTKYVALRTSQRVR